MHSLLFSKEDGAIFLLINRNFMIIINFFREKPFGDGFS